MSGIPSWAVKGAKVVCISDRFSDHFADDITRPWKNEIYTIRAATLKRGKPQVWLVEIVNHVGDYRGGWHEASFHPNRFRPVVPPKSQAEDIEAHFKHHLHHTAPERERA